MNDLVMQERVRQGEELSLDEVKQLVTASRKSGIGTRTVDELFSEAQRAIDARRNGRGWLAART